MQVDDVAEKLMPPGVRSLRNMLHATAVEVLLYLTPVHCHDMLSSLVEAMNAQFSRFMLRHPDFQVCFSFCSRALWHACSSWTCLVHASTSCTLLVRTPEQKLIGLIAQVAKEEPCF